MSRRHAALCICTILTLSGCWQSIDVVREGDVMPESDGQRFDAFSAPVIGLQLDDTIVVGGTTATTLDVGDRFAGLYRFGSDPTVIADSNSSFTSARLDTFGAASIGISSVTPDARVVVFRARSGTVTDGVFLWRDGDDDVEPRAVATTGQFPPGRLSPYTRFEAPCVSIAVTKQRESHNAVFVAEAADGWQGVLLYEDLAVTSVIADNRMTTPCGTGRFREFGPAFVRLQTVVFTATDSRSNRGLYRYNLLDRSLECLLSEGVDELPAVCDLAGRVYFGGEVPGDGVYQWNPFDRTTTPVVTTSMRRPDGRSYYGFDAVSVVTPHCAFVGLGSHSQRGLYWLIHGGTIRPIIKMGDLLDGKEVIALHVGLREFVSTNASREPVVVFGVTQSNLLTGLTEDAIYLATYRTQLESAVKGATPHGSKWHYTRFTDGLFQN